MADSGKTSAKATEKAPAAKANASAVVKADTSTAIERYEPIPLPANRPIYSRALPLVNDGSLPGNRPVLLAHLDIVNTETLPNHRPIIHSGLDIVNDSSIMGQRPIIKRGLPLEPSPYLPNNRPIATSQIYDSEGLMGYLD